MSKLADDNTIAEMRDLVALGDIKLDEERAKYKTKTGVDCPLTDDDLVEAIAATEDNDDDLLVQNMIKIENRNKMSAA